MSRLIGMDLGGTNLRVGVVERTTVVWEHKVHVTFSTRCREDAPREAAELVMQEVGAALQHALERHPDVTAMGIAVPGIVDPRNGHLREAPNLPGVRDLDLAGSLSGQFRLPVIVENDALAAAWGAYQTHPERPRSLIFLGLGTGIGGGLILDGTPYRGERGFAMEVGHLQAVAGGRPCGCGDRGCLERYASATAVTLDYQEATGEALDSATVARRAYQGDAHATTAFTRAGEHLGTAAAGLMKVLDVPHLVVGGGLAASWDLMGGAFCSAVAAHSMASLRDSHTLQVMKDNDHLGMLGAALLSKRLEQSPDLAP